MNFQPINPYMLIKSLEAENKYLRAENERLREELENDGDLGNSDNESEQE